MTARPRVLLLDDDAAIRRFVGMALEDEPLELLEAADVDQALALLRSEGPVQLVLTDLMLPGASGSDLVQLLCDTPALLGDARIVVLSAGLDAATAARLAAQGVWRQLHKPVGLAQLQATVRAALQGHADAAAPAAVGQDAIDRHFGGDRALYTLFRASCGPQFVRDAAQGQAMLLAGDWAGLRRLAHSLASVLRTLGEDAAADGARALEEACVRQDAASAAGLWPPLAASLTQLARQI